MHAKTWIITASLLAVAAQARAQDPPAAPAPPPAPLPLGPPIRPAQYPTLRMTLAPMPDTADAPIPAPAPVPTPAPAPAPAIHIVVPHDDHFHVTRVFHLHWPARAVKPAPAPAPAPPGMFGSTPPLPSPQSPAKRFFP
jgi:hypothetical protein